MTSGMFGLHLGFLVCLLKFSDGSVSFGELSDFMADIWNSDLHAATDVRVSIQGHTTTDSIIDHASNHLFSYVNEGHYFNTPTYQALLHLLDNYNHEVGIGEHTNSHEEAEISKFLDALAQTTLMQKAHQFLLSKGYVESTWGAFEQTLRQIWFELYTRHGHSSPDSSGFEHVFVGETDSKGVVGFHNWIQFYLQEKKGNLNYLGFVFSKQPNVLGTHFTWLSKTKGLGSFIYGTSPEFDVAMYTVCYLTRRNQACTFNVNGHSIKVQTYDISDSTGHHLGSAYVG